MGFPLFVSFYRQAVVKLIGKIHTWIINLEKS